MEKKQTNTLVMITAVILAVLGGVLLFAPQIKPIHICYLMCGVIVACGVYSIVRYYMSSAFRKSTDYGFSVGVFCIVTGIVGFIKSNVIVVFFPVAISMLVILFGVVILQDALDLKLLKSGLWSAVLVVAAVVIIVAMVVLINPFSDMEKRQLVANALVLVTGIVLLISKVFLQTAYRGYDKRFENEAKAKESESKETDVQPVQMEEVEKENEVEAVTHEEE
ncbi:MAG: hypothetical protein K6A30_05605 [Lachnospiraceae bacterium]|nr:hypothetical protein [Lachnospiraceae bacterium]